MKAGIFLTFYAIFDRPPDFPGHWVVRPNHVTSRGRVADPVACLCRTLAEAREQVPLYIDRSIRHNLGRLDGDPPSLTETWL